MKVFIFLMAISAIVNEGKVPQIDVFVESLCPDCMQFISGSFKEFYQYKVPNLAEVNFITFGNAKEQWDETSKKWLFTCQHKENECYGNLIETCAINIMGRVESYEVLICIEENVYKFEKNFNELVKHCVENDQTLEKIKTCVTSDMGNRWQHEMAQKTTEHKWVPWVVVNGVHDEVVENKILNNMVDYLCSLPGSQCNNDDNDIKFNQLSFSLLPNNFLGTKTMEKCYAN